MSFQPQRRKTAHFLHFIGAVLTGGLWILPWIIFTIYNASYNQKIDLAMIAAGSRPRRAPARPVRCTCEDSPHTYCDACGH